MSVSRTVNTLLIGLHRSYKLSKPINKRWLASIERSLKEALDLIHTARKALQDDTDR